MDVSRHHGNSAEDFKIRDNSIMVVEVEVQNLQMGVMALID